MLKLDDHEVKIVRELIKDPRLSDNAISKKTKIPVMTINRKRKKLEEKGLLQYYAYLETGEEGTHLFHARQLYIVQFRSGFTTEKYFTYIKQNKRLQKFHSRYVVESYLGEQSGRLALMMIIEAETETQLTEIFNGQIIANLKQHFGENCINSIITAKISVPVRILHNYLPLINMEKGKIKKEWPDEWIFTDIPTKELAETTGELGKLRKVGKELENTKKLKEYL